MSRSLGELQASSTIRALTKVPLTRPPVVVTRVASAHGMHRRRSARLFVIPRAGHWRHTWRRAASRPGRYGLIFIPYRTVAFPLGMSRHPDPTLEGGK